MALDFGIFPSQARTIQTAEYRSAGPHRAENIKILSTITADTYEAIHTVTAGKTFYVSALAIFNTIVATSAVTAVIATGESASEVDVFGAIVNLGNALVMTLPTPIKFSSGTRITGKHTGTNLTIFNLIGWEE